MKGFLKCSCVHCGGNIEFPGSAIDTIIACPHCGEQTALRFDGFEETAAEESDEGQAGRVFVISVILLLVAGAVIAGGYFYLKSKTPKSSVTKPRTEAPIPAKAAATANVPATTSDQRSAATMAFPPGPEHTVDADPAKHRFPLEATRRQVTAEITSGRQIYLGHCSECHVFHDPAAYSTMQWPTLLNKMEGKAKLGRDERERLERFIQTLRSPGT